MSRDNLLKGNAHFLLRTGTEPLEYLIRKLLTGYTVGFNRRYPLFQNRYKSLLCQEDAYFSELVRYIHVKPVGDRARGLPWGA